MDYSRLCMGCMTELEDNKEVCGNCGYKLTPNTSRGLQPQTILDGKYLIGKVIGEGGFGISYIAYDLVLDKRVAIKEYFPSELVARDTTIKSGSSLLLLSGSVEEQYKKGLDRFAKEAENLARFNNLPGIVSVKDFFYENNTAYMVMEYIDGITLSKYLSEHGNKLPYTQVLDMMRPVMESLQTIHEAGIIHRDISPDNIMITKEGEMKLIDFGAARFVGNNDVKSLTVILKHGYAPPEQYQTDGKQGPWTDVYALAATMYRMITGEVPQEATDRMVSQDKLRAVNVVVPDVPKNISEVIINGMSLKIEKRISCVKEMVDLLSGGSKPLHNKGFIAGVIAAAAVICVLVGGIVYFSGRGGRSSSEDVIDETMTRSEDSDGLGNQEDLHEISETEESDIYSKYQTYFYDNFETDDEQEYYIYFFDVQHRGTDDMIIMQHQKDEADKYIFVQSDGEQTEEYYRITSEEPLYAGEKDGEIYLCSRDSEYENVSDYTYKVFYLNPDADEKEVLFDEFEWDNGFYYYFTMDDSDISNSWDVLPMYLRSFFNMSSLRVQDPYDTYAGGIKMGFNHYYKEVFHDDQIGEIKRWEDKVEDLGSNSEYPVSNFIYYDFDNDGKTEYVISYFTGTEKYPELCGKDYTTQVIYDVMYFDETVEGEKIESFGTVGTVMCFSVGRFGRFNALVISAGGDEFDELSSMLIFYDDCIIIPDAFDREGENIKVDSDGNIYMLVYGGDWGPLIAYDNFMPAEIRSQQYYLMFIDGKLMEYDSIEINIDDFYRLNDAEKALSDAVEDIKNPFHSDELFSYRIKNILYSADDRIYINYIIEAEDDGIIDFQKEMYIKYHVAVFRIENGAVTYIGSERNERLKSSGLDIASYTKEYPY